MQMRFSPRFFTVLLFIQLTVSAASGQPGSGMEEQARRILSFQNENIVFDRVTRVGECTVYERFAPPSFVALSRQKCEIIVAAYSRTNLFFPESNDSPEAGTAEKIIREAKPSDIRQQKGIRTFQNPVGPLIRTQWGQGRYFNYACPADPEGPNGHVLPGCMSVAMAQIIRYYGGFNEIDLNHSFQSGRYGMLTANIGPYSWNRMENTLVAVNREVCDMLYDFSVLLHTAYSTTGSSANSHQTLEALHELGYGEASLVRKGDYSADGWSDLLYSNLIEYKPVLVTGGGHAFICDGFDKEGMLHFNLGGAGYGDGYYMPGLLVMGYPVNEMFVDLYPSCLPALAKSISVKNGSAVPEVVWSPAHQSSPVRYRIYVDETPFIETSDTIFNTAPLEPGIHTVHVTTLNAEGESRWIGPVDVFVRGNRLTIHDDALFSAVLKALGYGRDVNTQEVYEGDLSRIISLEIAEPLLSLEGIGLCKQLRRLKVSGFPGPGLDAGPLGNLDHLQVLEIHGKITGDLKVLESLSNLSELRFFNCQLPDIGFLSGMPGLMKFSYRGVPLPETAPLARLSELDELDLSQTGVNDMSFAESMGKLRYLRLEGNLLTDISFLQNFPCLISVDVSDNMIDKVVLTDQLQCLVSIDLHGNRITGVNASADLRSLEKIDLSGNLLASPGRFLLYTPSLKEINLSDNRLTSMGKYHPEQLSVLKLSNNQLITTEWTELQPFLSILDISNNRISDLAGLVRLTGFRQLDSLSVAGNPLSRETFETQLPLLNEKVNCFRCPQNYQPLSPCYPTPESGGRFSANEFELRWVADQSCGNCVFDLYRVVDDSLVLLKPSLDEPRARMDERPQGVLKWMVASRTADTVFWSGVYSAWPQTTWSVPFTETFEDYQSSASLDKVSDFWLVKGTVDGKYEARIRSSEFRNGSRSLELGGTVSGTLPMEHNAVPDLTIRFSARVPEGRTGQISISNLSGMDFRITTDPSGTALAYLNDRLVATFASPAGGWVDYRISANARNNQVFIWAGSRLIVSQPWIFHTGQVRVAALEFNTGTGSSDQDPSGRLMYVDDISLQSSAYTGMEEETAASTSFRTYPNPCTNVLNVELPGQGPCLLTVTDMSGRILLTREFESGQGPVISLPVENLAEGIYTLRLFSGSVQHSCRIIKSRSGY